MSDQVTRRAFLAAAGAAGALCLVADPERLQAALVHARETVASPLPHRFDSLTPAQAADLEAVCMRIFPTDDTPGAKEAGVIHFIDKMLSGPPPAGGPPGGIAEVKSTLVKGLGDLNTRAKAKWPSTVSFASLGPAQQDELLKAIEKSDFFDFARFGSVVGMFGNPSYGGNHGMVGWKLLGFESHGVNQPPFGWYDAEAMKGG